MSEPAITRSSPFDPLVRIRDGNRDLLVLRLAADGQAGEVVISTPSVTMKVRVPEIAGAFAVPGTTGQQQPPQQAWARTEVV